MSGACGRSRLAAVSFVLLCGAAFAQSGGRAVVSLSGPGALPGGSVEDEELVLVDSSGAPPRLFLNDQTLALYLGDRNGDGLMDEPNDIDALEIAPVANGQPVTAGVYFSLLTDQSGLKDGDVLRFAPGAASGGVEVVFSEAFLIGALAANDGNIDVDGMAFAPDGTLLFTLAEDETTGPNNVIVEDGSVLALPVGGTQASVFCTEAQIEAMAQKAMGSSSAVGDVKGLECLNGDLLFMVQSPSQHDATVFSTAGGGTVYAGLAEAALGFGNDVEADALALCDGLPFPSLELDFIQAKGGDPLAATVLGLTPASPFLLVVSGAARTAGSGVALPGFGVLALETFDPLFLAGVQNAPALLGVSDGAGAGVYTGTAPIAGGAVYDVAMQVLDVASGRISNPILLEVNQ
ncbi:MAG: hypothetical protein HY812_12365 [Planctomycetes bacterium]|nr:hypothetical protein [Planctomycetota bacterium]